VPVGIALGGAAIGGIATVASGAMSSHAQSKAADKAADTSLAVADKNNALYREIYGENKALLSPYSNNGLLASNALTDLLLGTHTYNAPAPAASTGALNGVQRTPGDTRTPLTNGYTTSPIDRENFRITRQAGTPRLIEQMGGFGNDLALTAHSPSSVSSGGMGGSVVRPTASTAPRAGTVTASPGTGASAPPSALSAWDQFRQGTNYQWRFNEGERAVTGNYATRGALDSGAAEKAKIEYGQNFASNELANYMNLLAGQQAMGLSAASAVAGVGQGYAGNVAAQNTNAANAAANAALANGQATAGMWNSIGTGVGQLGGALYQYGMGQQPRAAYGAPSGGAIITNPNLSPGGANVNWTGF